MKEKRAIDRLKRRKVATGTQIRKSGGIERIARPKQRRITVKASRRNLAAADKPLLYGATGPLAARPVSTTPASW